MNANEFISKHFDEGYLTSSYVAYLAESYYRHKLAEITEEEIEEILRASDPFEAPCFVEWRRSRAKAITKLINGERK